jgi:anti-anti-sigma factor
MKVDGPGNGSLRWTLRVDVVREGPVPVVAAAGRICVGTAGELTEATMGILAAGERSVLLDLAGVDYVSSAGLLAIEALSARFDAAGGEFALCGLSEPVRLVFELAGLFDHVRVEADRVSAIARIGNVPARIHP